MKITNVFNGTYISVKKYSYVDKDGRQQFSNYVALEVNDEVGNIQCTDDVMNELLKEQKYAPLKFQSVFDTYQKSFIIVGFCPNKATQ